MKYLTAIDALKIFNKHPIGFRLIGQKYLFMFLLFFMMPYIAIAKNNNFNSNFKSVTKLEIVVERELFGSIVKSSLSGTGFHVGFGYFVTNSHIYKASDIIIIHTERNNCYAQKIAHNPDKDMGVIYCKKLKELPSVVFSDSDEVNIGDRVYSIGSPAGLYNTLGIGYITGKNRDVLGIKGLFQTSVGTVGGSSGSPLFNKNGEVIGLIFASMSKSDNYGFAIPSNDIKIWVNQFIFEHQMWIFNHARKNARN